MNEAVMFSRLANIDVIALDAAVASGAAGERAYRLLQNRQLVAPNRLPRLLITTHEDPKNERVFLEELATARHMTERAAPFCQEIKVVLEKGRTETATKALMLHRAFFPGFSEQERKERILLLGRRGGKGKPEFIAPFTGGADTTCGTWTPVVAYKRGNKTWIAGTRPKSEELGSTGIRGFLRGNYAQGVCPAECSFCYLRGLQGMGMKQILTNIDDCTKELDTLPRGSVVNWAELGGPVEEDPWFVDADGIGSLVQDILDYSTERGVVAFFLTKGKYEPYLKLDGRLALFAISLNAPVISTVFEPGGAPAEERLKGLAWAIDHGLMDHTIRLGPIIPVEGYAQHYRELFTMMRDILGTRLKRITVDILRFSAQMPDILKRSFPEDIVTPLLSEMEAEVKAHKYRPSVERQQELYRWVNTMLVEYEMPQVKTTPCKADPSEAFQFLQAGDIGSMPCACHISYQDRTRIKRGELPMLASGGHCANENTDMSSSI